MSGCCCQRVGCHINQVRSLTQTHCLFTNRHIQANTSFSDRSRSGEPTWSSVTSSAAAPPWSKSVTWAKADILKPSTYKSYLTGADAVVHSMGILLEADYKGVVSGKESPIQGLKRAFSATKGGSKEDPLQRGAEGELSPGEQDGQITYELMNRDSGME